MSLVRYDILKFPEKAGESKIGKADILFLRAGATIPENIPVNRFDIAEQGLSH
jgi:hypothetical protein